MKKYRFMSMLSMILIFLLNITVSCKEAFHKSDETGVEKSHRRFSKEVSSHEYNEFMLDETYKLVLSSSVENGIAKVQIDFLEELVINFGCGNCEFVKNESGQIKIDSLNFNENQKGYVVYTLIRGSNYSAARYFIIHKNPYWNISLLPFDIASFEDINNDGFDEIIRIQRKKDRIIYRFDNGILKEL